MKEEEKKMKRLSSIVILLVLTLFVFSGITYAKNYEMVIGLTDAADPEISPIYKGELVFKNYVEGKSQGRIGVKIIPGGALGDATSTLKQVMNGTIQGTLNPSEGVIAQFYNPIQVVGIPYLVSDMEVGYELLDSPFFEELWEDMRKELGVVTLSAIENNGLRHFTNNVRPIKSPKDVKGLKIRTMQIPAHMKMVEALGGHPTPITWAELYTSLQTNVVDGQENSLVAINIGKLQEVQKYLSIDGHLFGVIPFLVNEKWYNSLPDDLQKIIKRGAKLAAITVRGTIRYKTVELLDELEKNLEIYYPTQEELQEFKNATQQPVIEFLKETVDSKWIDGVLEEVKEIEQR